MNFILEDEIVGDGAIRLFHGSPDDYVPVEPTRHYVDRLKRTGKGVQLTAYEGAHHASTIPVAAISCTPKNWPASRGQG
jgi:dienelactone hydrolase